jgi:cytochrome c556
LKLTLRHIAWLSVGLLALSAPVVASQSDIIKARIDAYRELGAAFKGVNDGLRGNEVQTVLVVQSARQIRNAARSQYQFFPAGSGPRQGVKTNAKSEIWAKPTQFRAAQDNFAKAANAFEIVAKSGNAAAMRAEARKLGATCKACHDQFRSKVD